MAIRFSEETLSRQGAVSCLQTPTAVLLSVYLRKSADSLVCFRFRRMNDNRQTGFTGLFFGKTLTSFNYFSGAEPI